MIFVHKYWREFCRKLHENGRSSITAGEVLAGNAPKNYLVLKHDVETNVQKAFAMAEIENQFGHKGSYYVQAYLLHDPNNIRLLKKMQEMGHEISYHYDVMDSAKGDFDLALKQYEENKKLFEENGFYFTTVCQHGNPVVERVGYTSNRDFFRNPITQSKYPDTADIMVNFPELSKTEYLYFSDAGRHFKLIFDPLFNDITNSDDKNILFKDLDGVAEHTKNASAVISVHPHRWESSAVVYHTRTAVFKVLRTSAKIAMKLPFLKKIMSKYYYLAKKI